MQKIFDRFTDWFISQDFVVQIMIAPAFITVTLLVALTPWIIVIKVIKFISFMLFNYA